MKGGLALQTYRNIEKKESTSQTCKMHAMAFIATVKVVMKAYTIFQTGIKKPSIRSKPICSK